MKWQNSVRSATDLQWKRNGAAKGGAYIYASPHEERGNGKSNEGFGYVFPMPTTVFYSITLTM
jgi:hypothetical protein